MQVIAKACSAHASEQVAAFEKEQGQLLDAIRQRETKLIELKGQRRTTPKKITLKDLPPEERFPRLPTGSKHFVDTIKMIACPAQNAGADLAGEKVRGPDDVRFFVLQVLQNSANLIPPDQEILGYSRPPLPDSFGRRRVQRRPKHLADKEGKLLSLTLGAMESTLAKNPQNQVEKQFCLPSQRQNPLFPEERMKRVAGRLLSS